MNINPLQSEFRNAQFSQLPRLLGKPRSYVYVCKKVTPLGESKTILFNSVAFQSTLPRDVSTALRLLNMTVERMCHSERSRGISWKRNVRLVFNAFARCFGGASLAQHDRERSRKPFNSSFALPDCSHHMLTAWALFCPLHPNREQDNNKPL